jgi:hypothetical protein
MVAFILGAGVLSIEWYLRRSYLQIARSDRITPGLTHPDPELGWTLTPGWRGTHEHHDYKAAYSINGSGFRGADARFHPASSPLIALVGDSFTFGTGVNDGEEFTQVLDREMAHLGRFYNFSVPGFSTDQEVLLIEREVLPFKPRLIVLVVYLANDLFDNQLTAAIQVRRGKPRFVLEGDRLVLTNSPVVNQSAETNQAPTLLQMIAGHDLQALSLRQRLEGRFQVFRTVSELLPRRAEDDAAFESQHAAAVRLFWALVDRLQEKATSAGSQLALATLAGRSYVEAPSSLSATFQDFFRRRLATEAAARRVPFIDVAGQMRERYQESPQPWFYPNEGHLTAQGHQAVASIVKDGTDKMRALSH